MTDERKENDRLWEKYAYCVPPSEEETALQERRLKPASAFSLPLISLRLSETGTLVQSTTSKLQQVLNGLYSTHFVHWACFSLAESLRTVH